MRNMDFLEQLLDGQKVEWKKLGEVAEFYGGLTGKSKEDFSEGNAYYISYKNIYENYAVDASRLEKVNVEEGERQHAVQYGDVLITGSSENLEEAGMSSVVTFVPEHPIYLNSFSFGVRFHQDIELSPEFTKHLFRSHLMRKQIMNTAQGVTRFNVSKRRFATIEIPLPSLSVQSRIVEILDKFTSLEAELEAELDCRKRQYIYYRELLLDFSDENKGYKVEWKKLGEVCIHLRTGLNPRTNFKLNTEDASNYYVTVRELNGTEIVCSEKTDKVNDEGLKRINHRSQLKKDDILFSGTGTIGKTAFITEEPKNWNIKEGVYAMTVDKNLVHPKFFLRYIQSQHSLNWILSRAMGAAVVSISMNDLKQLPIPLPPLSEQARIVEILDKFDALTNSITEGLPLEIKLRKQQYEYYREQLLNFPHH